MKKTLALLLAVMMLVCLCAACGDKAETTDETATTAAAPAEAPAAPAAEGETPAVAADGEASADMSGEPQTKDLFPADGYDKTFDGYKSYVSDALKSDGGSPFLEDELAAIDAATETDYDPTSNPWAMQIEFGLILSYEDFLAA